MAKGEGAEQYSNASLLNKSDSTDEFKLARKVSLSGKGFQMYVFLCMVFIFYIFSSQQKAGQTGSWWECVDTLNMLNEWTPAVNRLA